MDLESNVIDASFSASSDKSNEADVDADSVGLNIVGEEGTASKIDADINASDAESKAASVGTKSTRGRGYQENRRGKKAAVEKSRQSGSDQVFSKADSKKDDEVATSESSAMSGALSNSSAHDSAGSEPERKAKGDVNSTPVKKGDGVGISSKSRQENNPHKPSGDGDVAKQLGISAEQNRSREDLLNLLKHPPRDKRSADRDRLGPSRDLKNLGKSASELEEQWKKEAEQCRNKEEEAKRKQEEDRLREEENQRKEEEKKRLEEEELQRIKEEELKYLDDFTKEARDRIEFKTVLREQNLKAAENRPDESFFFKLDSNLKKNTAFVKKVKNLTESQKDSIVKDLTSLNLTKYVGEVAAAVVEAKLKMSDISCALAICSLMYQRYADFSPSLMENWQKVLLTKKDDKVPNPTKLRVDLRLFADLIAVGVFTEKEGLPMLANQLTLLTVNDKDEHNNLTIIISFCKHCGDDYAGLVPRKFRLLAESHNQETVHSQFLPGERQKACRNLLKEYYSSLCKHLLQDCKEVRSIEKQNRRALQTKGELSTERKEKYDLAQQNFQKLLQNAMMLADLLDEDLPKLPEEELKSDSDSCGLDIFNPARGFDFPTDGSESGIFEDEDTRQFYESLPDLKAIIPGILYKDSEQPTVTSTTEPAGTTEDDLEGLEDDLEMMVEDEKIVDGGGIGEKVETKGGVNAGNKDGKKEEEPEEDCNSILNAEVDEDETDVGASMKTMIDTYLTNLPNCVNRELIDKAAIDFCMNLNTKTNRRKLVRALFHVHRTRYDLLPFYARLVAMLSPCMPNVPVDLSSSLKTDFKYHVRKKDQINIESKLKTVRFIAELVKFNMYSKNEALHCLKMLMADFAHHNIEMACSFLETCGRFLYRHPESHQRMKVYLEVIMRKKAVLHMDSRYATMIENAYYYSNPPEVKSETQKELPPMHSYIRRLLYKDLNKTTIEKVLRQIRKLDWDSPEIRAYTTQCFNEIWNIRYNCIHCCANLVAGLASYHETVTVEIIDCVLEDIRLGMEVNYPKYNQRRLSMVKFLGELYNYRMVESQVIFRTLYSFISFGVSSFDESRLSLLDPPEHLFRIRLVCVLLDTCGQYFDHGSSKKKLDCFLVYFQRYFWFKKKNPIWNDDRPFSMEVEYMFRDTLEFLRPKLKLCQSWAEASQAADELDNEFKTKYSQIIKPLVSDGSTGNSSSLPTIRESEEQESLTQTTTGTQESDGDVETDERGDQGTQSPSQSQSQKGEDGIEEEDRIRMPDDQQEEDYGYEDEMIESAGEDADDDKVTVLTGGPKHIKCSEDDDFMAAFDKMMQDTYQARTQEMVKTPVVEISVPVTMKTQSKAKPPVLNILSSNATPPDQVTKTTEPYALEELKSNSIPFTMLTRKGNKQQFSMLSIPVTASFAAKFQEQKEAEKAEKERMKKVVLDIHERQEEEDYQEMLALMNRPLPSTNRERRLPYQHPKGAPDADAIFGSKKR